MKWPACLLFCFTVTGNLIKVIDGDTLVADVHIFLQLQATETVRVLDIDTPERRRANWVEYLAATAFTRTWLEQGPFTLHVCERDSFGRLLAVVSRNGEVLADRLRKAGHAKPRP